MAAFGPAGSTGELNISVIVAPIQPDFSLESLGNPEQAGQRILDTTIATKSSGVTASLLSASQRCSSLAIYCMCGTLPTGALSTEVV